MTCIPFSMVFPGTLQIFVVRLTNRLSLAGPTNSFPVWCDPQIVPGVRMPVLAVRDPWTCGPPTFYIFLQGNWLQMVWVDAFSVSTKMVEAHPLRDWADVQLIREPVGKNVLSITFSQSVPINAIKSTNPVPARRPGVSMTFRHDHTLLEPLHDGRLKPRHRKTIIPYEP